ncbi:DUF4394 domain-containing protein [Belnapia sp. T18]|uniref:DUF4394 domain-containing protein n=1 Tax=Belnapia arida TaxID=2804533 RepID=A0ABS1TWS8_9PROT|nr:DUF4394 domain-containing protein [Belnapia arida]MBL6076896.1 DUF4394 domain-containing protein [Belnapia arida]
MTRTARTMLAAGAALALSAAGAEAATLVGLTADNHLVRIDSQTRRAMAPVRVTGIEGRLLGIDVRPADMKLYGLTDAGQIVTIDAATGRATQVSRLSERFESGGRATIDFNPVADRLRVMGMNGANLRINVDNGQVAKDGQLRYQAGTPWAETTPRVVAGAYTNSIKGATATMLFTVDTLTRSLNLQAPPNEGVQQPKGEVAPSLPGGVAFDIMPEAGGGNMAVLIAGSTLHHVDLSNGKATTVGQVTGLPQAEVIDIAVVQ